MTELDYTDPRVSPLRPRGSADWARERLLAGDKLRKVIWPPGPCIEICPDNPDLLVCTAIDGVTEPVPWTHLFRADETADDLWELHPPAPTVPTLHAPVIWMLFMLPNMGGPASFSGLLEGLASGQGSFAEHVLALWKAAGAEAIGVLLVGALGMIDRATIHKSLLGHVPSSLEILRHLNEARARAAESAP